MLHPGSFRAASPAITTQDHSTASKLSSSSVCTDPAVSASLPPDNLIRTCLMTGSQCAAVALSQNSKPQRRFILSLQLPLLVFLVMKNIFALGESITCHATSDGTMQTSLTVAAAMSETSHRSQLAPLRTWRVHFLVEVSPLLSFECHSSDEQFTRI